jgi:hypothetical protein
MTGGLLPRLAHLLRRAVTRAVFRVLDFFTRSDALWDLLASTGITIFVGPNGSGKSLAAILSRLPALDGQPWECWEAMHVHHAAYREHARGCEHCPAPSLVARLHRRSKDVLPAGGPVLSLADAFCAEGWDLLEQGSAGERLVYSTVPLIGDDGEDHPRYRPLTSYSMLLRIEHAEVIFDEVAGVSDASDSGTIPVQVVQWMHTLRKADVRLAVTTPAYGRCSKPIRQVAQVVVDARSYFPEPRTSGRLWRPRQVFAFAAYDATTFEDFTVGAKERLPAQAKAVYWRPGGVAERRYDTLGQVLALGHVSDHGLCTACGGTRSRPRCACPADHDADTVLVIEESVSNAGARVRKAVPASGEVAA